MSNYVKDIISVIIPAYNAALYLEEAVKSVVVNRCSCEVEIIVIDDGSTDNTLQIAETLPVRVFSQSNQGAAAARNLGIKNAKGNLFLFLDADDLLSETALEALYTTIKKGYFYVTALVKEFHSSELSNQEKLQYKLKPENYKGILGACIIRAEAIEEIGGFNGSRRSGETVELLASLRDKKYKYCEIEQVVYFRRIHKNNTGRLYRKQEFNDYADIIRKRMMLAKKNKSTHKAD